MNTPLDELARIAEGQIGTQEDAKHQNRGSAILKYQEATNLGGQGWPWCAAFVDFCMREFFARHPEYAQKKYQRPETAAAFGLIDWGREENCFVFSPHHGDPARGDIVVYTFSHCGIVADADLKHDSFHAIEGNSNPDGGRDGYEVVRHARNFSSVNRFIRLPLIAQKAEGGAGAT
jgi:hypothetical protein